MNTDYFAGKKFDKQDFTHIPLAKASYENCVFIDCDFSNSDLSGIHFIESQFESCNLSMAKLIKTSFQDVRFIDCKMLGLHFKNCNDFGMSVFYKNCNLSHSSFYQTKFKKTTFKEVKMNEVDFTESDLSASIFDNCDFLGAIFENTNLEKADLRTSFNYTLDPEQNRIKRTRFSSFGLAGLLRKYDLDIDLNL